MADDLARVAHDALVPGWNELREQRVLGRVLEARRRAAVVRRRALVGVAGGAVLAAAAALVLVLGRSPTRVMPSLPSAQEGAVITNAEGGRLALSDGSVATLGRGAGLRVDTQRPADVALTQTSGEVRYDVRPQRSRRFEVHAGRVIVRVRGTAFTVTQRDGAVTVRVHHGHVEVEENGRITDLHDGESLTRVDRAPETAAQEPPAATNVVPSTPAVAAQTAEPAESGNDVRTNEGTSNEHRTAPTTTSTTTTPESLMSRVDTAREHGQLDEAATLLRELLSRHPRSSQAPSAMFTLARVERSRGHYRESAESFEAYAQRAPRGALAEDALAEAAESWSRAGDASRARTAAQRYLDRHPNGSAVARMRSLAQ